MKTMNRVASVPKPAWSRIHQEKHGSDILAYADSVIASRGMTDDIQFPFAASIMIGKRVLAKGNGGFFHSGRIIEVNPSEIFTVEFDKCPELHRVPIRQENLFTDIISLVESSRHSICVANKVLVPLSDDREKYVPGTVIEENSRSTVQEGCDRKSFSVALYNGETLEVDSGVACWIPIQTFDKIVKDLSSRNTHQINGKASRSSTIYNEIPRWTKDAWESSLSAISLEDDEKRPNSPTDNLQRKIEKQIKEGEYLLKKLQLVETDHIRRKKNARHSPILDTDIDSACVSSDYEISPNKKVQINSYLHVDDEKPPKSRIDVSSVIDFEDREERRALKQIAKQQSASRFYTDDTIDSAIFRKKEKPHISSGEDYFKHRAELLTRWDKREQPVNHHSSIVQEEEVRPKPKRPHAEKLNRCLTRTGGDKHEQPVNHHSSIVQEEEVRPKPKRPHAEKLNRCLTRTGGDKHEQPVNHHSSIVQEEEVRPKPKRPHAEKLNRCLTRTGGDKHEQSVNHHSSIVQEEEVRPKPKRPQAKKLNRCHIRTGGKIPHPPEIRATNLSRSVDPKSKKLRPDSPPDLRPEAAEYHTSDGVPFPPRTDHKFDSSYHLSKSWTLSDAFNNRDMPRSHDIITNKVTKPVYVSFGQKGLEKGEKERSCSYVHQQRKEEHENNKYVKEKLRQDKEENHRARVERRELDRAENLKTWREAENRMMGYKQEIRESVERFYKDKEEAAQTRKYDRLDAMRQRKAKYNSKDADREETSQNEWQKQNDSFQEREEKRRDLFHEKLQKERNDQDIKLERLRKIQEKRTEKESKRTTDIRGRENLRSHVNEIGRNMLRAGILP